MSTRMHFIISDELKARLDKISEDNEVTSSEVLRKSIVLFCEAHERKKRNKKTKLGFLNEDTQAFTEIINL